MTILTGHSHINKVRVIVLYKVSKCTFDFVLGWDPLTPPQTNPSHPPISKQIAKNNFGGHIDLLSLHSFDVTLVCEDSK